ncbi:MAG: lamin tail domain-containing protein, partial [Syntrophomonadaceae bacterium]|nr:lamin tail domain-containing protein [Syntrophomonadaceae bacterium]
MTIEEIVTSEFPDANLFGKYLEVTGKVVKLGNYYYLQAEKGDQLSLYQSNTEVLSGLLNQKVTLKVFFYGNQSAVGTGEWRAVFAGYEGEYSIVELTPGEKIDEAINDINITDGQTVTGNLVLPTEGLHGVVITWESSNPDIISETGEVTRPAVGEDDATVTLTATFSVEGVEEEVEYTVTVLAEQESGGNFAEDLFISEYIEGSSNNKAIEIFNGTGQAVDLSQYTLILYSNGGTNPGSTLNLNGTLAHGGVIVIYNSQSSSLLINAIPSSVTKASHGVAGFNGDDAIELLKGSTVIDVFGVVGESENWGKDVTLVRKPEITKGNTTYNAEEWIEYSQDTFNYLGSHEFNSSSVEEKTPEEKIAEAKAEIPLTDNQEVTDDLVLPTVSAHGVTITWESSDSAIISETGEVTRPA